MCGGKQEEEEEKEELEEEEEKDIYCVVYIDKKRRRCSRKATMGEYCTFHHNDRLKKGLDVSAPLIHQGVTNRCNYTHHHLHSKYPKENVPIEKFLKTPPVKDDIYKYCQDCRNAHTNSTTNRKINLIETNKDIDPNFKVCTSDAHDKKGVSIYPRESVPIAMFAYISKNATNISSNCSDCRAYMHKYKKDGINRKQIACESAGNFCCHLCNKMISHTDRALKKDGTQSLFCINCKYTMRKNKKKRLQVLKTAFRNVQMEMMVTSGCSCQICKSIFLQPIEGTEYVIELPTYEKSGKRYVNYKGETYVTSDFLKIFANLLEFRIIELDHLSEVEQRERGIIGPNEAGIKKKDRVSALFNEYSMREESKITQNLCSKCHVIQTISREKGEYIYYGKILEKKNYVDNLKRESGCVVCKFFDESLLRFLELDHLNPDEKISGICEMIQQGKYTLEELIEECKKCRIICRFCHVIHTDNQRKLGTV